MRTFAWTMLILLAAAPAVGAQTQTATVLFQDQTSGGVSVVVTSTTMSEGGFLTIHNESLRDGDALGSVVGVSEFLASGIHTNLTVSVSDLGTGNVTLIAMPHLDTDGDEEYDFVTSNGTEDGPYTQGGQAVTDDAVVTVRAATVQFEDQTVEGDSVTVASGFLPAGGFMTLHDQTLQNGMALSSVVGTSTYLEAGRHTEIRITVDSLSDGMLLIAMPHRDTNGNETYDFVTSEGADDGPYTKDGAAVTDSATISTSGSGNGNGANGDGDDDDESAPGLGAVAVLVALAAAVLMARRR